MIIGLYSSPRHIVHGEWYVVKRFAIYSWIVADDKNHCLANDRHDFI